MLTVNACALRTTTERRVNVPSVPMIALDVESASAKSPWLNCRVRRTLLLGIPISTLDASAMMDIVARTAHRRSVPLERISLVGMEALKDVNVLDVAFASIARVFVVALMDTMETGASTRLFSAKRVLLDLNLMLLVQCVVLSLHDTMYLTRRLSKVLRSQHTHFGKKRLQTMLCSCK